MRPTPKKLPDTHSFHVCKVALFQYHAYSQNYHTAVVPFRPLPAIYNILWSSVLNISEVTSGRTIDQRSFYILRKVFMCNYWIFKSNCWNKYSFDLLREYTCHTIQYLSNLGIALQVWWTITCVAIEKDQFVLWEMKMINALWASNATCWHKSWSTIARVLAGCPTASSHCIE